MDIFQHAPDAVSFPAGAVVYRKGDPGDGMYVVKSGELGIRDGTREVARVGPGEYVGEMGLIAHTPRVATVVAVTDAVLVPIDEKKFLFLVNHTPRFALDVLRSLVTRLRTITEIRFKE